MTDNKIALVECKEKLISVMDMSSLTLLYIEVLHGFNFVLFG